MPEHEHSFVKAADSSAPAGEGRTTAATRARVDHLAQARDARGLVDRLGDEHHADPVKFMAAGVKVGETQRIYLFAAAVDALIDIATSLRELTGLAQQEVGAPPGPVVERICRYCGCTDEQACPEDCSWVTDDLCSACEQRAQDAGSDPLGERGYVD
jgi:hypothetical protein